MIEIYYFIIMFKENLSKQITKKASATLQLLEKGMSTHKTIESFMCKCVLYRRNDDQIYEIKDFLSIT